MTDWTYVISINLPDHEIEPLRTILIHHIEQHTGQRPTTRTIQTDALKAALLTPLAPRNRTPTPPLPSSP